MGAGSWVDPAQEAVRDADIFCVSVSACAVGIRLVTNAVAHDRAFLRIWSLNVSAIFRTKVIPELRTHGPVEASHGGVDGSHVGEAPMRRNRSRLAKLGSAGPNSVVIA